MVQMKTTILTAEDIRMIVKGVGLNSLMIEMINRLQLALETLDGNNTVIPVRGGFEYKNPDIGLVEWMPILQVGEKAIIKIVGYHPSNPILRSLPTILSTIYMLDTNSGHLIGIADATLLTALRTGAASAVASKVMASPHSKTIGLIGCGAQALTQLHAISLIFDIEKVLVFDIDFSISQNFLNRAAFLKLNIEVSSIEELVQRSDIICTATSVEISKGPVFDDMKTKTWLHINAVGSDFPGKIEIPVSLLKRSVVCPDFLGQAIKEGECQQLSVAEIGPDLCELVKNIKKFSEIKDQLTVFDSTGWALEDHVAMEVLIDHAAKLKIGQFLEIESISNDPYNPYEFLHKSVSGDLLYAKS